MTTLICEGCGEPIDDDDNYIETDGEDWHITCSELRGGPSYCCGLIYEDGEDTCVSCGEPL